MTKDTEHKEAGNAQKPKYTTVHLKDGKIIAKEVYEDSLEYFMPFLVIAAMFLLTAGVSGYFFFQEPFEDRLEYFVIVLVMISAVWETHDDRSRLFLPAFILGGVWAGLSLFIDAISFNLVAYVFSYCVGVLLLFLTGIMKSN